MSSVYKKVRLIFVVVFVNLPIWLYVTCVRLLGFGDRGENRLFLSEFTRMRNVHNYIEYEV